MDLSQLKINSDQTSSAGDTLIALFDKAIENARGGAESIRRGDMISKGKQLQQVCSILTLLTGALDRPVDPEMCENLEQLYLYMKDKLVEANVSQNPVIAEEVISLLDILKDAWVKALDQVSDKEKN